MDKFVGKHETKTMSKFLYAFDKCNKLNCRNK